MPTVRNYGAVAFKYIRNTCIHVGIKVREVILYAATSVISYSSSRCSDGTSSSEVQEKVSGKLGPKQFAALWTHFWHATCPHTLQ